VSRIWNMIVLGSDLAVCDWRAGSENTYGSVQTMLASNAAVLLG